MRMFSVLYVAVLTVLGATGCSTPVVVSEVLQQPIDAPIYTKYNLWYEDPEAVNSLNIQQGRILPVGTKVEPLEATDKKLRFKTEDGSIYQIDFDSGMWMCSMREFIQNYLTLEPPSKILAAVRPDKLSFVKRGEAVPGMTREEVLIAYGPPPTARTPSRQNETWIYFVTPYDAIRVVFRDNIIRNIINPNE